MKLNGKTYTCKQSNGKLIWKLNKKKSNSSSASSTAKVIKVSDSDTQLFYTTSGCKNEIVYVRFNEQNQIISKKTIVKIASNVQLIPHDYNDGQLLFSTYNCSTQSNSLYTLDIKRKSSLPIEIIRNPKENQIVNAQWDVATDTPLALVSLNNLSEYVVITGNAQKQVLWSSVRQGWGSSGGNTKVYPAKFIAHTGREFVVFGNAYPGWTSVKVNYSRSLIGTETEFRGTGTINDVAKGWLDGPYGVALNEVTLICSISPFVGMGSAENNLENSKFCSKVSNLSAPFPGRLAFGLTKPPTSRSISQILIDAHNRIGFSLTPSVAFHLGQIRIRNVDFLPATRVISATEISFNIGEIAPSIILNG